MTEREESFFEYSRDLVIAVASGVSSNTGLAPELRGRRAEVCLSLPGFPLQYLSLDKNPVLQF